VPYEKEKMLWNRIKFGVYSGVAGGMVFGLMMAVMGTLPMIGSMVGIPTAWAGFLVHVGISAMSGGSFGFVRDITRLEGDLFTGAMYGSVWWLLGPLTLMPLFMGMGWAVNWTVAAMTEALQSLVGHVVFGVVLGTTYRWFEQQERCPLAAQRAGAAQASE